MKNVGVFYGGKSVEHDISIITAMQVMNNKIKEFYFLPIYIRSDGTMVTGDNLKEAKVYLDFAKNVKGLKEIFIPSGKKSVCLLKKNKVKGQIKLDCALLCNHGHGGEDGSLQGLLELADIPYTSCSIASSALCMDKVLTKIMLDSSNIQSPAYLYMNSCSYSNKKEEFLSEVDKKISYPCIVKPARLGSSVGISICENEDMLTCAIENAFEYDNKIIVEKFVKNAREFCCAVVRNAGKQVSSKVTEVVKGEIYTFEEKYLTAKEEIHGKISKALEREIKTLAIKAYEALECDGVVRVDFLYDEMTKQLYVNEINSIPGSLAFNLFDTTFPDLIKTLIREAEERSENQHKIVYKFNSKAIEKYLEMTNNYKVK